MRLAFLSIIAVVLGAAGCSSSSSGSTAKGHTKTDAGGSTTDGGGSSLDAGGSSSDSGGSGSGADASVMGTGASAADVKAWAEAYKKAHPGNGGKDWDINAIDAMGNFIHDDADARKLRAICGPGQLPIIPMIAWEYGGSDHQWVTPDLAALVYCVYTPVNPGNAHWNFDTATGTTTTEVYVLFPDQNPCKDKTGADQVMACLGDPNALNIEIIVDTINLNDGIQVGLDLSNSPTEVYLIQADGKKVHLYSAT